MNEVLQCVLECPIGIYVVTASLAIDASTNGGEDIYRVYRVMSDGKTLASLT